MGKIKLILILVLVFGFFKVYQTIGSFEKSAKNKIVDIQDKAGIVRQEQIIALLLFKRSKGKLIERYPLKTASQCIHKRD